LKQYKLIIFDLDGTLTDSGPGIINSVHYALEKMGISEDDRSILPGIFCSPGHV
jgi:phosphoglycolate phosphatase